MDIRLSPTVNRIVDMLRSIGGRVFVVGGAVRDALMGLPVDDIDIEVFNVSGKNLHIILSNFGNVTVAGKFSIYTVAIDGVKIDFSLPRRDNLIGDNGHSSSMYDFDIDPFMTPEEAAKRRDLTINSMMVELPDMFLYDFFGGRNDLARGILRATSDHFGEDPLRVMRGIQFISRFGFRFDNDTRSVCESLVAQAHTLVPDEMRKQWKNWALGTHAAKALSELHIIGWTRAFPELHAMIGVEQDPFWHPEGDVWAHTLFVVEAMSRIIAREGITDPDRIQILMLAALLHDVGKPLTTVQNLDHRWIAPNHAEAGIEPARAFLSRIGVPNRIKNQVLPLIREHMSHIPFFDTEPTARSVRRLAVRLGDASIEDLMLVIEADHSGRPPLPQGLPSAASAMLMIAREIEVNNELPKPILLGRHLIEMGMKPSKDFGVILENALDAQLNGIFNDVEGGKAWLTQRKSG